VIVYSATKGQFLHDCDHEQIEDVVERQFVQKTGRYGLAGRVQGLAELVDGDGQGPA